MKKEDLIVLKYASNTCYVQAVDVSEAEKSGLEVDIEKELWTYRCWHNCKIGTRRSEYDQHSFKCREGIIGVYDRTNTKHLSSMVHHAGEATGRDGGIDVDYY